MAGGKAVVVQVTVGHRRTQAFRQATAFVHGIAQYDAGTGHDDGKFRALEQLGGIGDRGPVTHLPARHDRFRDINLSNGTDIHISLSIHGIQIFAGIRPDRAREGHANPAGKGKKDVHAIGAHILIIPQQDGITRLILILLLRR